MHSQVDKIHGIVLKGVAKWVKCMALPRNGWSNDEWNMILVPEGHEFYSWQFPLD